jgi:hypothetical protein
MYLSVAFPHFISRFFILNHSTLSIADDMVRFGFQAPLSAAEAERRRKRRYQSRSDEEIEAEMDNRGLHYRHGWPLLPPLPVETVYSGAFRAVHNAEQHLDKVENILHAQRVQTSNPFFAYRVPNNASDDEPIDAFLTLVATVNTAVQTTFDDAIIQIRQYLKAQDETKDISIELIDYRAMDGLLTFPIHFKETAILEAWDQVSNIVETEISNFHEKWLSIELLHRGLIENRCAPTVVITSPSAGDGAWTKSITPAIRQRLRNLTPLLDVEVLCATTLFGVRDWNITSVESYGNAVMGCSIGIANEKKHAGTIGGFVTLSDGKQYGLTSHHVVCDDLVDKGNSDQKYAFPHR